MSRRVPTPNAPVTTETQTDAGDDEHLAWTARRLEQPHKTPDKAQRVEAMFAAIASSYDLNNRLHSIGRDQAWRRAAAQSAGAGPHDIVLDVACGTGDLSLAFTAAGVRRVLGVDFTLGMLCVANQKRGRLREATPCYQAGDAQRLPVAGGSVDVVSIGFGIRNVVDPGRALKEFFRVLRPGGRLVVLEFSLPSHPLLRGLYHFYFNHVMPRTATLLSHDRSGAYKYLPKSVDHFMGRPQMVNLIREAGFVGVETQSLTLGIAVIYRGVKKPIGNTRAGGVTIPESAPT